MSGERTGHRLFIERMIIALALIGLALLLWNLRGLFMLVCGALLVAVILNVIATPLEQRLRLPPRLALIGAVLTLALLLGGATWIFGAEVARQATALKDALPGAWQATEARLDAWSLGDALRDWTNELWSGGGTVSNIGTIAVSVGNAAAALALMLVAGAYFAARPNLYRTGIIKLVPAEGRPLAGDAIDDTIRALKLWLLGRVVSMVVVGVLTWIGLTLIGIPSALTLALLAALLEFVPYIGPIASAVPAVLLAFAQGPEAALWTALLFFAVQQFEGYVLEPMVQQRAVDLPPALLLFALVAGGMIFGLIGILFAEPLTVMLFVLVKRLYVREALHTPTPLPGEDTES